MRPVVDMELPAVWIVTRHRPACSIRSDTSDGLREKKGDDRQREGEGKMRKSERDSMEGKNREG
jgi:hypothetical protein